MSWRTVVITKHCKLDYKLGFMVVRSEDTKKVLLDEISIVIIENTSVSLTCCLVAEFISHKIKVIFCDEKRNPSAEIISLYGSHDCSAKLKKQLQWNKDTKAAVWTSIIAEKIRLQSEFLNEIHKTKEAKLLKTYLSELVFNDLTNREGHAAKVYFNAVFGMEFTRSTDNSINAALNYGYSIILSAINREVECKGYLTQLGIFHDNVYNKFNLSCDLMEPFRILVDRYVYKANFEQFKVDEKHDILNILNYYVTIDNQKQYLMSAIKIYCSSIFEALNDKDVSLIKFYRL